MFDLDKIPMGLYEKALPNEMPISEKLITAKKCGYDFFEISIDETDERLSRLYWDEDKIYDLAKSIKEANIPILSMCLSGHRRFPFGSNDPKVREKAMDIMKRAIKFSSILGIRTIQLAGYDVYYEESNKKTVEQFKEGLLISSHWAQKSGVMLAIEVMDTEFINSIEKAMEYVNEINSPWLKVYPDIGNMSAWGNDIDKDFDSGKGSIIAVHVKETKPSIHRDLTFGEGNVDFVKCFKKLRGMNYFGPFLIEMWANKEKNSVEEVKNALSWVKNKMREGGYEC